jgi:hypothetical protein
VKCLYYLAPTIDSVQRISDDLHQAGIHDFFLHVVSRDEAGLKRERIHSSNYLETLDLLRAGFIGANLGFVAGVLGAGLIMYYQPFGDPVPGIVYVLVIALATCFGGWEGGLYGVATRNQKLKRFEKEIDAGKYLILIYARRDKEEPVRMMMQDKHKEAEHVATDSHFLNPFSVVRRQTTA